MAWLPKHASKRTKVGRADPSKQPHLAADFLIFPSIPCRFASTQPRAISLFFLPTSASRYSQSSDRQPIPILLAGQISPGGLRPALFFRGVLIFTRSLQTTNEPAFLRRLFGPLLDSSRPFSTLLDTPPDYCFHPPLEPPKFFPSLLFPTFVLPPTFRPSSRPLFDSPPTLLPTFTFRLSRHFSPFSPRPSFLPSPRNSRPCQGSSRPPFPDLRPALPTRPPTPKTAMAYLPPEM